MKALYMIIITLIISFYSCDIGVYQKNSIKKIHFTNKTSNDLLNSLEYKFIPLETTDKNLISSISQIKFDSTRIYIIDKTDHVYVFDLSGKFIGSIGENGNGPNEYMIISDIHLDKQKQEIVVADGGPSKLIYYHYNDFSYLRSQRVANFVNCIWLENGDNIWYNAIGYTIQRKKFYLERTNSKGEHISYMYPSEFSPEYTMRFGNLFSCYKGNTYFYVPFSPYIYNVSEAKEEPSYEIVPQAHQFAPLDWLQANAQKNYANTIIPTDYISAYSFFETSTHYCIQYFAKGANPFLGFHCKLDGASYTYGFKDFIKGSSLNSIGAIINTYQDYFITSIPSGTLKDRSCHIPELAEIAKNIKVDDNPILCLFKFKEQ